MHLRSDLACVADVPRPDSLDNFRARIDPEWIQMALEATGTASLRRRRLPAEQVIWLVLGMALFRDRSIVEVAESLNLALPGRRGPTVAPSAVAQARARLSFQDQISGTSACRIWAGSRAWKISSGRLSTESSCEAHRWTR